MAKNFYQLNPDKSLLILEAASTLGGTWAKDRLYPGLKSNNMLGTYEYPDFPMDPNTFEVKPGEHIPGTVLHDYLTAYAERFGIIQKVKYGHKVLIAEHLEAPEGAWVLTAQETSGAKSKFATKKLVVATGLTSQPLMPDYNGQESFDAPLFHNNDFLKHAGTIDTAKSVTVFGGTKSSWDAVYEYATKGVHVDWVIRGMSCLSNHIYKQSWTNQCSSNWPWPMLDGAAIRDTVEEVARETCPYVPFRLDPYSSVMH